MSARPTIAPSAAAAILSAVPSRLIKKLDADPKQADKWKWSASGAVHSAVTPSNETVTITTTGGVVATADAVKCSCLLSPKCMHVAAAVTLLAPAEGADDAAAPAAGDAAVAETDDIAIDPTQHAAAQAAWRAATGLIATGGDATGTAWQAGLLRAIHECRTVGLHRAATAATRVLAQIRELRADDASFTLSQLGLDLRELLVVTRKLVDAGPTGTIASSLIGVARRRYRDIGGLRVHGVFTDAVFARSGYSGVVTYVTDGNGALYTVSDVAPGDTSRAAAAYEGPAEIGDATLAHRELGRAGLFLGSATASRDGRLGAGKTVKAVRSGPSAWTDPALAPLWKTPLADQLARLASAEDEPIDRRPAGWDLIFTAGELVTGHGAVGLKTDDHVLVLVAASDSASLRYRDNLIVLARMRGRRVRMIGRARLDRPASLAPLAIGPEGADDLDLAAALAGRANLAFDRLARGTDRTDAPVVTPPPPPMPDPLIAMKRRLDRVGLGGALTLPPEAAGEIAREAAILERRMMPAAAAALRELAAAATTGERRTDGRRAGIDADRFATAWLRASIFVEHADRRIARTLWLG